MWGKHLMKLLEFKNITDIDKALKSEKHCRDYYEWLRWEGKVDCAHCGAELPIRIRWNV